eukprot:14347359-Alexandrium_andersonii.AAC.1
MPVISFLVEPPALRPGPPRSECTQHLESTCHRLEVWSRGQGLSSPDARKTRRVCWSENPDGHFALWSK